MPVYCIVGYGRQGLVAGETIVIQVLTLLPLNTGTVDVLLPLSVLVWSLSLGGAQLECKLYNWKVQSSHVWPDQIEVTTIWAMGFPIVHFTFYPCKILPESRHQERHSSSIDLVRYVSSGLSNCTLVHMQPAYIRKILWKMSVLNILWQMLQSYWRLHTSPHNVWTSLDPSWVGHGCTKTNSLLDVKN